MKKRTAESLYEMMQPLSDHHRIPTRHSEMLRFYNVLQARYGAAVARPPIRQQLAKSSTYDRQDAWQPMSDPCEIKFLVM